MISVSGLSLTSLTNSLVLLRNRIVHPSVSEVENGDVPEILRFMVFGWHTAQLRRQPIKEAAASETDSGSCQEWPKRKISKKRKPRLADRGFISIGRLP